MTHSTSARGGRPTDLTVASGDLNLDTFIDSVDIDTIYAAIAASSTDSLYDLDGNGVVDQSDVDYLVHVILWTTYGDANLDGVFDSSDLVQVFQADEYEDSMADNSTWAEGDFDGDQDFESSDLVFAMADGGYVG